MFCRLSVGSCSGLIREHKFLPERRVVFVGSHVFILFCGHHRTFSLHASELLSIVSKTRFPGASQH